MTRFEVEQSIQSEISVFLSSSEELLFHTVIGAFEDVVKATKWVVVDARNVQRVWDSVKIFYTRMSGLTNTWQIVVMA